MEKINKKIKSFKVKTDDIKPVETQPPRILERLEVLNGLTYKIKTPQTDHAFYITINNTIVDDKVVPFEMFINSKNMQEFQWITALTKLTSAIFRHNSDLDFISEELKSVYDPKGGYFVKGEGYVTSIVSHIGIYIEKHLNLLKKVNSGYLVCKDCGESESVLTDDLESRCMVCNNNNLEHRHYDKEDHRTIMSLFMQ